MAKRLILPDIIQEFDIFTRKEVEEIIATETESLRDTVGTLLLQVSQSKADLDALTQRVNEYHGEPNDPDN